MSSTEKISVTIGREELVHAKQLASRMGISLSGFISEAVRERVREQQRREAALEVLASFSPEDRASIADTKSLLERWAPSAPSATGRPKRPTRARTRKP